MVTCFLLKYRNSVEFLASTIQLWRDSVIDHDIGVFTNVVTNDSISRCCEQIPAAVIALRLKTWNRMADALNIICFTNCTTTSYRRCVEWKYFLRYSYYFRCKVSVWIRRISIHVALSRIVPPSLRKFA